MMNHDRLSEVFHREIVKQEEAQKRKKLSEKNDAECLKLREENEALKLAHNNEKIRIRWEHADEVCGGGGRGIGIFVITSELVFLYRFATSLHSIFCVIHDAANASYDSTFDCLRC